MCQLSGKIKIARLHVLPFIIICCHTTISVAHRVGILFYAVIRQTGTERRDALLR
jgi:hypothetical protein